MKVVILAGGYGTRLSEHTDNIPKPMVTIGGKPIIWHIMRWYARHGFKDFYLALGYRQNIIKEYFLNYRYTHSDFTVTLDDGTIKGNNDGLLDWRVTLVDTGLDTMTGGRLLRLKNWLGEAPFMLTYGDGVGDIDLRKLSEFHTAHKKLVTVTAVHPSARFGELTLDGDRVKSFIEKPQVQEGWVNGGFFVINPKFIDLIEGDNTVLEQSPLEEAASSGELVAYRHEGFWQCMDTKRDKDYLEGVFRAKSTECLVT